MHVDPLERVRRRASAAHRARAELKVARSALIEALHQGREHGLSLSQLAHAADLSKQRIGQLLDGPQP